MNANYVTSHGEAIQLTRELGKGGEGAVFEISGKVGKVAKLYHKPPDAAKQAKLSFMALSGDQQLWSYVAWPQDTLHTRRGGPVVGFLMPKVTGMAPIHMVYSPAHRRQDYPKAGWDFLLFVARNAAACFETVHSHGHIIGDVNQNGIMVGRDSKVVLIDSDSFQINAHGTLHRCNVGVSHFTPPELQAVSSFSDVTRTVNHDNFGLALLIFHLLFGGRHPYSGVPARRGVGEALERDIQNFRYAYARDAQARGIGPPPRSIPLSIVPESMEAMFQLAFTERGAAAKRPIAQEWMSTLDSMRMHLQKCSGSPVHTYSDHLSKCPWCVLEQQGVVYFVDLGIAFTHASTGFVLGRVWAMIEAVPVPSAVSTPTPDSFGATPRPLPSNVPGTATITAYRLVAVGIAVAIGFWAPGAWFWALLVGIIGWNMASAAGSGERNAERVRRRATMEAATHEYEQLVRRVKAEAGPEGFIAKRADLTKLRDEYQALPQTEKRELDKLHSTARERQKHKFLDTFFIDSASIPGVGPARKAMLRSFGIETAADVTRNRVRQVRGFGNSLTRAIMDWKGSCERKFSFNPSIAVSKADRDAVRAKCGSRRIAIEVALTRGVEDLKQFRHSAALRLASLKPQLENAARKVAQASADLSLL